MTMTRDDIDRPGPLAEVTAAFGRYEAALIANDVGALTDLFYPSATTIRYGIAENLYGHDQITAFRKGRPAAGLDRILERTVITTYGEDFATAWTLFRRGGPGKVGRQSQAWAKIDGAWKVVAAHVSIIDDPEAAPR